MDDLAENFRLGSDYRDAYGLLLELIRLDDEDLASDYDDPASQESFDV